MEPERVSCTSPINSDTNKFHDITLKSSVNMCLSLSSQSAAVQKSQIQLCNLSASKQGGKNSAGLPAGTLKFLSMFECWPFPVIPDKKDVLSIRYNVREPGLDSCAQIYGKLFLPSH